MLQEIIEKLRFNENVDAVFVTGSLSKREQKPYSDIDVVVILNENRTNIRSVYEKIDGVFADIFFFDKNELEELSHKKEVDCNSFDGMLVTWINNSDIKFDKSGLLTRF